jgi:ABC-type uncharacterized transport system ATPase subunit
VSAEYGVRTECLARCYGDSVEAHGVDVSIERAEVVGYVGLIGAGKTAALRLFMGLRLPTAVPGSGPWHAAWRSLLVAVAAVAALVSAPKLGVGRRDVRS